MFLRVVRFERRPFAKLTPKEQEEVKNIFGATISEDVLKKSLYTLYDKLLDPLIQQGGCHWSAICDSRIKK